MIVCVCIMFHVHFFVSGFLRGKFQNTVASFCSCNHRWTVAGYKGKFLKHDEIYPQSDFRGTTLPLSSSIPGLKTVD